MAFIAKRSPVMRPQPPRSGGHGWCEEGAPRRDGWGAEPDSHLTRSSKCESGSCNPPCWILSHSVSLGYLNLGIVFGI